MPACARKDLLSRSLIYHVFNRSNAKAVIFRDDFDYEHFKKLLQLYSAAFLIKIYHWVIMPTHYHLLLELSKPEQISKIIAGIALAYTQYFHKKYESCGFLWQGRFKSQPVQKEGYLIACGRYIDRNPVKANIVTAAEDYSYSSAQYYCLGINDGITTIDPMYEELCGDAGARQKKYSEFLKTFDIEEEQRWDSMEAPQGDKAFLERLIKDKGRVVLRKKGGARHALKL
jgi:putative transposase